MVAQNIATLPDSFAQSGYGSPTGPAGAGNLIQVSPQNALTALAAGGQTGATALQPGYNRVTTVATIGDSVILPTAKAGLIVVAKNGGATPMDVFPATGDAINALAANVAIRVSNASQVIFVCDVTGTWDAQLPQLPAGKYTKNTTSGATTAAAGDLTGAAYTSCEYSAIGTANVTTRTATQMFNDVGNVQPGDSYVLEITNTHATLTLTLVAGAGVTLTGTMTVAANTTRRFNVKFTSATALVIQGVGVGTIS